MENKQTAVEWLYERLERMIPRNAIYNTDKQKYFEQAKQMEKEQEQSARKESYDEGWLEATQYIMKRIQ